MALRPYPGFVGPSYTSQSRIAAYDRTVNWYPERIESGTGVAQYVLYPTPGYQTLVTVPTFPGRAMLTINGVLWSLYGDTLYTISTQVVLKAQGLSDTDGSVAQMVTNGDAGHQLLIRADTTLYALDFNAPIVEHTFINPPASSVTLFSLGPLGGRTMVAGYYGYAFTYVNASGETTASPRVSAYSGDFGGTGTLQVTNIATGVSDVTARKLYRTTVQATQAAADSAQLQLRTTLADNSTTSFDDIASDASLGANVPTTNTAAITIEALTTIPAITSNMIAYLNGYGLSLDSALSQVNFSALLDFTSWDPLDVFQRSDTADRWKAMLVNHNEIYLFGSETTSVYYNADDPTTPFQPITSAFIPMGIIAANSACVVDGVPMWIGQGINGAGVVYKLNGYTPVRVSTFAVEWAIEQINNANVDALTLAEGSTYQEAGHVFYELTFPTSNGVTGQTWVYDATEGLWTERGAMTPLGFVELDTRGHGQINGPQYTMSRTTGAFYRQWIEYATGTDGLGIVRLRRAPHLNQAQQRTRYTHFRLLMETGLGLGNVVSTNPGYDPQITLSWSNDGGQTFGTAYPASAGRIGEFSKLVEWRQLEQGQDRIFELTCSAPVPWRLIDAFLDYSVGPS